MKVLSAVAICLAPAWAASTARPGVLNYIEGRVTVDQSEVGASSSGQAALEPGQVLRTNSGRAEVLLTPGVYLRLDQNSSVRMNSTGLTDTRVDLLSGRALVEATDVHPENHIRVAENRASVELEKNGLYAFDVNRNTVGTLDGKARVMENDQEVEVKRGRELNLNGPVKPEKFDKKQAENSDPLYRWSKVRSDYLAEANLSLASRFAVNTTGWYGAGWYWDPFWHTWSFLPGTGYLYSPFGAGFYSPWAYGWGPNYYYYRPIPRVIRPHYQPGINGYVPRPGINSGAIVRPGINPGVVGRSGPGFRPRRGR